MMFNVFFGLIYHHYSQLYCLALYSMVFTEGLACEFGLFVFHDHLI